MTSFDPDIKKGIEALLRGPKYPDKEFVLGGATFKEVYRVASMLRTVLCEEESPGSTVCLATDNKPIMAAAILASLGGGPNLLVPYTFSEKPLLEIQRQVGFTTVISDSVGSFPEGLKVISPQSIPAQKRLDIPLDHHVSPGDELLQLYTGGSTGSPQMWTKTGENLFGEGLFLASHFGVTEQDCILGTVPANHIYGLLYTVILPLVSMATVVDETPSFPGEIVTAAEKNRVSILASVPAHYRGLGKSKIELRLAFSSAGMLDEADNRAFSATNGMGVTEVYGSTETGGIATRNRWLGEDHFTPFPSIRWKTSGGCLAVKSSYISPELAVDEEGFYRASDRVEKRDNNAFALLGRADHVTKVGGKRVDLDEIRLVIKKQPGVVDCVVTAVPFGGARENLIGVLIEGNTVDIESIRLVLADSFETYALPRWIKTVERIPMKESGKYDSVAITQLLQQ